MSLRPELGTKGSHLGAREQYSVSMIAVASKYQARVISLPRDDSHKPGSFSSRAAENKNKIGYFTRW